MAQFDEETIIVYQAYRPEIGHYAVKNQRFGGAFSFERMSWIKPNFLWMMYRSGWGAKQGQEVVLAVRLRRDFFDGLLVQAIPSSFEVSNHNDRDAWQTAVRNSNVRLQWDPDHDPRGGKLARRAIQLGLRGNILSEYATDAIIEIMDISELVVSQREQAISGSTNFMMPAERTYRSEFPSSLGMK